MVGWNAGGPKYREHLHDFRAAVFGYSAAGVLMAVILHAIYLSSPGGHAKIMHILGNGGAQAGLETVTLCGGKTIALDPNSFDFKVARFVTGSVSVNGEQKFTFDKLNFATDSATITPDSQDTLQSLGTILAACTTTRVRLSGYTDSTGDAAHNKVLSQQRAEAVKAALVGLGIDASRLEAVGYGAENPVAPNDTDAGRAQNRRTELVILNR